MKAGTFILFLLLVVVCGDVFAQSTATRLTDRSKKGIVTYLNACVKNHRVIVGQQCSGLRDADANYNTNFQPLISLTGKLPGLLGLEYGWYADIDLHAVNRIACRHWRSGGLVSISWHAGSPWSDSYNVRYNSVDHKDTIDLSALLKNAPPSKAKAKYRAELQRIATALKELKDSGVIVLWRPLHEMNGSWFWWGSNDKIAPSNQSDYRNLWKDMYETLTVDFGLDNLIWVYAPGWPIRGVWPTKTYPGDEVVDLVGGDYYPPAPVFPLYPETDKIGKPLVNGEIGPGSTGYGSFDELEMLNGFKGHVAYFLQWNSWPGGKVNILDNVRAKEMMNDPDAITLDKMK